MAKSNKIFILNVVIDILSIPRVYQRVDDEKIGIELPRSCKDRINNCLIHAGSTHIPTRIAFIETDFHSPHVVITESPFNIE